jgi:hypothetical protein
MRPVGVLGDLQILLHLASRIGQKCPMRSYAGTVLIGRHQVISTDGDQAAVTDFHFAMEFDQTLCLAGDLSGKKLLG